MSGPTDVLTDGSVIEVPADTWAPVLMRWRLVRPGDVFLDRAGLPWSVTNVGPNARGSVSVVAVRADDVRGRDVHPDDLVNVLIPLVEREAVMNLREAGVTGQLIERTAS